MGAELKKTSRNLDLYYDWINAPHGTKKALAAKNGISLARARQIVNQVELDLGRSNLPRRRPKARDDDGKGGGWAPDGFTEDWTFQELSDAQLQKLLSKQQTRLKSLEAYL